MVDEDNEREIDDVEWEDEHYRHENDEESHRSNAKRKSRNRHGFELARPTHLKYRLIGSAIEVKWKHLDKRNRTMAYYIQIQEKLPREMTQRPFDFVHVDRKQRMARIRGLKPTSTYNLQVMAVSRRQAAISRVVEIDTTGLEFLRVWNLTVSGVKDRSATFTWYHNPKNNVHDIKFKLLCQGMHLYSEEGKKVEESTSFQHLSHSTSNAQEVVVASTLVPVTKYVCHIRSVAGSTSSDIHDRVTFTTLEGNPSRPPQPKIVQSEKHINFTLKLYRSSDYHGSIGHYTVYAMPVHKKDTEPVSAPFTPLVPYPKLISKSVSSHLAASTSEPVPYVVGQYQSFNFPKQLEFNGTFGGKELKPETHYSFVVFAFSAAHDNGSELKYSMSNPTDPPVFIDKHWNTKWIEEHTPVVQHFLMTILWTFLAVIGLLGGFVVTVMTYLLIQQRREKKSILVQSEESDDEQTPKFFKFRGYRTGKKKSLPEERELLLPTLPKGSRDSDKTTRDASQSTDETNQGYVKLSWLTDSQQQRHKTPLDHKTGFYSVTTPHSSPALTDSPEKGTSIAQPSQIQTLPLTQSRQGMSVESPTTLPMQRSSDSHLYLSEEEPASKTYSDPRLQGSYSLPRSQQYSAPKAIIESQGYYKKHGLGSPRRQIKGPKEAPSVSASSSTSSIQRKKNVKRSKSPTQLHGGHSDAALDNGDHMLVNITVYSDEDKNQTESTGKLRASTSDTFFLPSSSSSSPVISRETSLHPSRSAQSLSPTTSRMTKAEVYIDPPDKTQ